MPADTSAAPPPPPARRFRHFHPRLAAAAALVGLILVLLVALLQARGTGRPAADTSANRGGTLGFRFTAGGSLRGQPLPQAGIVGLDGAVTDLPAVVRGRPTLVNFFSSTCTPCITELPALQRLAAASGGRPQVVGIDVGDSLADTRSFLRRVGVHYPVYRDPKGLILEGFDVTSLPATLAISADGHIVNQHYGAFSGGELSSWAAGNLR